MPASMSASPGNAKHKQPCAISGAGWASNPVTVTAWQGPYMLAQWVSTPSGGAISGLTLFPHGSAPIQMISSDGTSTVNTTIPCYEGGG